MGVGVSAPAVRWAVRCEFHTTPARATREAVERLLAEVEAAGHCSGTHEVVEVER